MRHDRFDMKEICGTASTATPKQPNDRYIHIRYIYVYEAELKKMKNIQKKQRNELHVTESMCEPTLEAS